MGNDGGSIPTRRELVKEAARALTTTQLKETQNEQQEYYWSHDPITRKPLAKPVVSDSAGSLYNKETILEYLIPSDEEDKKADADKIFEGRVKSLKDVVEVKFEVDESGKNDGTRNGGTGRTERWVCPITGTALGPSAKAVYIVPCGHAFAGSVMKEVASSDGKETCLQCNEPYAANDVIPILPAKVEDIARLSLRVKTLKEKGLSHSLKLLKKEKGSKKRKKGGEKESAVGGVPVEALDDKKTERLAKKKDSKPTSNGIKNAATASITAKVLEEQEARNKRRKLEQNENVKGLFTSGNAKSGKNTDFMTRGFTFAGKSKG